MAEVPIMTRVAPVGVLEDVPVGAPIDVPVDVPADLPADVPVARWGVWAGVAVATFLTVRESFQWINVIHPDVTIGRNAAHLLLGPGELHLYAQYPVAQMGPGAILLSLLPRPLYLLLIAGLLGPVLLRLVDAALAVSGRALTPAVALMATVGAVGCAWPWSQLAWKGHADDALVLAGAAMMLPSRHPGRRRLRIRLIGVAVAALGKPTAVVLLGLTVGWEGAAALAAVVVFALVWLPFVVVDPAGFLHAGRGVMAVGPQSLPNLLGYQAGSAPPSWIRFVQLGGGALVVALAVVRQRPLHALLAAFVVRAVVDPNPAPAYCIGVVVLALAVDLSRRQPLPWTTAPAVVAFWASPAVLAGGPGEFRAAVLLGLLAMLLIEVVSHRVPRPDRRPALSTA